ncbi:dipeptide/oligopeptide/nickel ABC transporter permease/ATP-binding protein [Rothia sp. ZJ932]|uniref:dipeptide/oligopeptide/nickel ABC transporter permease/ATP-binding protein n=1 Tax=Rothia sp. ZJ932 TaxID=2810516 RepID=UPI00196760FD|nr:dipeptide/oligopeptide/nickel ABC transporter permease/ATP-binding protein [Rothia sp. ZJ932]QRZ61883.1 dipeptide/oligopeptide/nickel ABC transporter permease/ATP-binding protein [Rothia sp. ZJ932]
MRSGLADRLSQPGIRFKALPLGSKIALTFLALIILMAAFAPFVAPHDPLASTGAPISAPDGEYLFGTDRQGRDVLSRLVFGARASLQVGLGAVALALALGGILGAIAATGSKVISEIVMRLMDILMAFPGIALAAVLLASLGNSVGTIIVTIAIVYTPQLARVVRAQVLAAWDEDYVRAERVMGAARPYILLKHVVRNTIAPVLVFATVMVADAIILEASLSFLSAGVRPPSPSWGNVIADGRALVLAGGWWATTFAGLVILLTVLALNVLSEGMTDAMVNPKLRRKVKIDEENNTGGRTSGALTAAPSAADDKSYGEAVGTDALSDTPRKITAEEISAGALISEKGYQDRLASKNLEGVLTQLKDAESRRGDRLIANSEARVILEVKDLSIFFPERFGDTPVVDRVSFTVHEGQTMGLVGESGSGKSITSLAIIGLLDKKAKITGSVMFEGQELVGASEDQYQKLRGAVISMVYQDALSSLNPSMLIKDQMLQLTRRGGRKTPEELLTLVKLDAERTLNSYPHELSGGQRQRVLIAMALSRSPKLVIADEPTTALDVTVQKEVIALLNELREQLGFAMIFVSHDLALVAQVAHRISVMYAGQVVESGATSQLLMNPKHEYTRGLLGSVLSIESGSKRLYQIPGTVPSPGDFAKGDRFAPRSLREGADPNQQLVFVPVEGEEDHYWASHLETTSTKQGA